MRLVLGGGGVVGRAWMVGMLAGLHEAGAFEPERVTTAVGTSAGAIVASRLMAFRSVDDLVALERSLGENGHGSSGWSPDRERFLEILGEWTTAAPHDDAAAASIGAIAAAASCGDPASYVAAFERRTLSGWPDADLRIVTTACSTGTRAVWTREAGVPIATAVAASCAVPGFFPCVELDGSLHMDGGVVSTTNADLVATAGPPVMIVAPMIFETGHLRAFGERALAEELDALRRAGVPTHVVTPGPAFARLGPNLLDPSLAPRALDVGHEEGRQAANEVRF